MNRLKEIGSWSWNLVACGGAMTFGVMVGASVATALGLELPVVPNDGGGEPGLVPLLASGIALSGGLAAMNAGMSGRRIERFLVLALFAVAINGLGNLLEASIFSTLGGELAILSIRLSSTLLCAAAVVLLFQRPSGAESAVRWSRWARTRAPSGLAARFGIALVAFPLIYLTVGVAIAPIVTPYYEKLELLVIPPLGTLIAVLSVRSLLLLLGSLPVIVAWSGSRRGLVLSLGLGHFVAVGMADLIQASFFPAVLRWVHGTEILVDSICYALVLSFLFLPPPKPADEATPILQQQTA